MLRVKSWCRGVKKFKKPSVCSRCICAVFSAFFVFRVHWCDPLRFLMSGAAKLKCRVKNRYGHRDAGLPDQVDFQAATRHAHIFFRQCAGEFIARRTLKTNRPSALDHLDISLWPVLPCLATAVFLGKLPDLEQRGVDGRANCSWRVRFNHDAS